MVEPDPDLVDGWRVEEEFVNAIRGLEPVRLTDFDTGVRYMEWTDAVRYRCRAACGFPCLCREGCESTAMTVTLNPDLVRSIDPPIAEVRTWVEGRQFPAGRPLIDLAQAVPSYPPAGALRQHLAERTALFETAQYTPITGIPPLREALAARMTAEYGGAIAPSNVLITAGCNQAFCVALLTLARSGDEVILPVPYYFNHQMWVQMQGIVPVGLPFRPDRSGVPDPADAARLITERTRAIVLVTPNNPTGATCPPEVLAAFHDLAVSRGIALVLDETYRDFLDTLPAHTLFQDPTGDATWYSSTAFPSRSA